MHKVLDLFSGIGGFSLGLERTGGFETVAFCEIDEKARKVLGKHWPDVPIYEDIKEMTIEQLQADGIVPTVITGGFPCQDISFAGKGAGIVGERSSLWNEMFRLIRDVRPEWVIAENVSALRSRGLALVLQDLCSIGYCVEWHCIPASAVGAPHQRDRIWIIAHPNTDSGRQSQLSEQHSGQESWSKSSFRDDPSRLRSHVANTNIPRLQRRISKGLSECSSKFTARERGSRKRELRDHWETSSGIQRVADGIPKRVDRLKQIGNAVVPQIPELLGTAILSSEGKLSDNQRTPTP